MLDHTFGILPEGVALLKHYDSHSAAYWCGAKCVIMLLESTAQRWIILTRITPHALDILPLRPFECFNPWRFPSNNSRIGQCHRMRPCNYRPIYAFYGQRSKNFFVNNFVQLKADIRAKWSKRRHQVVLQHNNARLLTANVRKQLFRSKISFNDDAVLQNWCFASKPADFLRWGIKKLSDRWLIVRFLFDNKIKFWRY